MMINQKKSNYSLRYKVDNISVCNKWKKDLMRRVLRIQKIRRLLDKIGEVES